MKLSLRALLTDLEIRATNAEESLRAAPSVGGRSADTAAKMGMIAGEARTLLGDDLDGAADRVYASYKALTQAVFEHETFELPFLVHHDEAATRATRLCEELLADVGWPYSPMTLCTFSTEYYWTFSDWRVIALPCGEERRLLGIADLCHELGHAVYGRDDQKLVDDFMLEVRSHLNASEGSIGPTNGLSPRDFLTEAFYSWQEGWLQEFACDLLGTYLVGPAFPRQHARLRAMSQPRSALYGIELGFSHPPDDARMRACLSLTEKLGFETEAQQLAELWAEIVTASGESKPDLYEVLYPPQLLDLLVDTVKAGCEAIGLRAYDPGADPASDIPRLANEAWERLDAAPEYYARWERETLTSLWSEWGV